MPMRINVNQKSFVRGDAVRIVPWMRKLYQRHADRMGVVKDVNGNIVSVKFDRSEVPVAVEHLEKAH